MAGQLYGPISSASTEYCQVIVYVFLDVYSDSNSANVYNQFVSNAQADFSQISSMASSIISTMKSNDNTEACANYYVGGDGWFAKAGTVVVGQWNVGTSPSIPGPGGLNSAYIAQRLVDCGA